MNYIENIVIAKPDYCVPAVLEMVLKHYNISNITQDDIAAQFTINQSIYESNPDLWGIIIEKNTINEFFRKNNFSLVEEFISINSYLDEYFMAEKIAQLLSEKFTVICGYNYSWLFGNRDNTFGHVSIITEITPNYDKVKIIDPGPKNPGIKWIDTYSLYCAIKAKRDGLWCIKET